MFRAMLLVATLLGAVSAPAFAAEMVDKAPPPAPYQKVSALVKLPDFLPGMGTLYVDPKTLPAGPFLAYDHSGRLVSTLYMIPLKDMNAHNMRWSPKTGQVAKRESPPGTVGWPKVRHGEYTEETQS